jgi:hypothetical protein
MSGISGAADSDWEKDREGPRPSRRGEAPEQYPDPDNDDDDDVATYGINLATGERIGIPRRKR